MNLRKTSITLFTITLILFAIGTFFDWQINTFLAGKLHLFGQVFAVIGLLPIYVIRMLACIYLLRIVQFENLRLTRAVQVVFLYLAAKFAGKGISMLIFMTIHETTGNYPSLPSSFTTITFILGLVITLVIAYYLFKVDRELIMPLLGRVIMVLAITYIIDFEMNFIKEHVGRARYYTVEAGNGTYTPWYVINGLTDDNDFMSFISGHTTMAFSAFLPVFFTLPHQVKLRNKLYIFGVAFGGLTALSRMVLSQHYLTDVTGSLIVSAVTIFIMCWIFKVKLNGEDLLQEVNIKQEL